MRSFFIKSNYLFILSLFFLIVGGGVSSVWAQQHGETLHGQVSDSMGGVITAVTVTAVDGNGKEYTATTNQQGQYTFAALPAGHYTVRVNVPGFTAYENKSVEVPQKTDAPLDIALAIANTAAEVTVSTEDSGISTEPDSNADSMVLKGEDLDSLPDDPDDLADAIQALTGTSAGVDGTSQVYIDGFNGGRLPPKSSIREIRINRSPFSAEFDRMGYGRVEILTKPGTDKFRGEASYNFNDESLNSRSPFASYRAPFQVRRYEANLSGPIISKKASFFLDFERRSIDDNRDITAFVLDKNLNPVTFNQTILNPTRRITFSPRVDWQLNDFNTIVARYTYENASRENDGVGTLYLMSRAYETKTSRQTAQITETAVINKNIVNETRFQFIRDLRDQSGGSFDPALRVLDAFYAGGAQIGNSYNYESRYELQNFTSWTTGQHSLKVGAGLRLGEINNASEQNFGGTFTFGGGTAPLLDANNNIVTDGTGATVTTAITSLERYRRTLLLQQLGFSPGEIRTRGGGATQFSIAGGDPDIKYSQLNISPFVQDDWRIRPNLTVSLGLRYDWQSDIGSVANIAPRFGFAWSPRVKKGQKQKTVIRGGVGIFYNSYNESLLAQSLRYNGTNQQQYVISTSSSTGQSLLNSYPNVPTFDQLSVFSTLQTVRRMDEDLRTPYVVQTSFGVERQLPFKTTLAVNFLSARTYNVLRSRNVNAPIPGLAGNVRPLPGQGNIFEFESTGRFNQEQLNISLNNRFSRRFSVSANYSLNNAMSDTDGLGSFPVNQYDLTGEYARSTIDIRHRFTLYGSLNVLPWAIRLSPMVILNSGRPFNITTGRDTNSDTLFTERPAFADASTAAADLRHTSFGDFDANPKASQTIIPRNYGTGPSFAVFNLRIARSFQFGAVDTGAPVTPSKNLKPGDKPVVRKRFTVDLSMNVQNVFNNTNESIPVGNLSSPLFGIATGGAGRFGGTDGSQSAGNRRIDVQLRFNF